VAQLLLSQRTGSWTRGTDRQAGQEHILPSKQAGWQAGRQATQVLTGIAMHTVISPATSLPAPLSKGALPCLDAGRAVACWGWKRPASSFFRCAWSAHAGSGKAGRCQHPTQGPLSHPSPCSLFVAAYIPPMQRWRPGRMHACPSSRPVACTRGDMRCVRNCRLKERPLRPSNRLWAPGHPSSFAGPQPPDLGKQAPAPRNAPKHLHNRWFALGCLHYNHAAGAAYTHTLFQAAWLNCITACIAAKRIAKTHGWRLVLQHWVLQLNPSQSPRHSPSSGSLHHPCGWPWWARTP